MRVNTRATTEIMLGCGDVRGIGEGEGGMGRLRDGDEGREGSRNLRREGRERE